MNIFLRQAIERVQRVINTLLPDVKLAFDGAIVVSETLRDARMMPRFPAHGSIKAYPDLFNKKDIAPPPVDWHDKPPPPSAEYGEGEVCCRSGLS